MRKSHDLDEIQLKFKNSVEIFLQTRLEGLSFFTISVTKEEIKPASPAGAASADHKVV